MSRPLTRKVNLKEGFYIEVFHSHGSQGIKIRRDTYEEIQQAVKSYKRLYHTVYLGKMEKGKFVKTE